ncbi:MFS transporter [Deltaproteobacteria bacterium]|nr:MFS transporter [Deltaproteobacteria bacterium]
MRSERAVIGLVGAVQFVNILDFMMVMPLGPDFAVSLGVPMDQLGVVGGAYTLAAGISGLALSPILDRADRRVALAVCMAGLAIGTALGGFATDLTTLVAARVVAGAFGGPATSVAMSIVADVIPVERRGRALGAVMGAFSVASVFGVPAGLWLAQLLNWRTPFFAVAAAGALIAGGAIVLLPSLRGHLDGRGVEGGVARLLGQRVAWSALAATSAITLSAFIVIPNLSSFIQFNLLWPREGLGSLYMAGGVLSFVGLRLFGPLADRFGSLALVIAGSLAFALVGVAWWMMSPPPVPVWVLFPAMMLAMSARNVAHQSLLSKVAEAGDRAAFQSLNSATQHLTSAVAAFLGTILLTTAPGGALVGMPHVAWVALIAAAAGPLFLAHVQQSVGGGQARPEQKASTG